MKFLYNKELGFLIIRISLGIMFIIHGMPKLLGGVDSWASLGQYSGFSFLPAFWGFMAAITETLGGLFIALGLFTRITSSLLMITMLVATLTHLGSGDSFAKYSHALKLFFIFGGMVFIGSVKILFRSLLL